MTQEILPPGVGERVAFFEAPANLVFLGALAFLIGIFFASSEWSFSIILALVFVLGCAALFFKKLRIPHVAIFLLLLFFPI